MLGKKYTQAIGKSAIALHEDILAPLSSIINQSSLPCSLLLARQIHLLPESHVFQPPLLFFLLNQPLSHSEEL